MQLEVEGNKFSQESSFAYTGSEVSFSMASAVQGGQQFHEYLKISIKDTGLGMNPDIIKGLFELFGNSKMNDKINQSGIGLGLTVAS